MWAGRPIIGPLKPSQRPQYSLNGGRSVARFENCGNCFFFCSFKHANDLVCHLECKIEYWHKNTVDAHRKWRNDDLAEWSSQHYSGGKNKNLWWTKAKVCKWHTKTNNRKNSAGIRRRHLFGSITFKWHELRRTPITFYNVTMIRIWPEMNEKINYLPSWRRQPTIVPSALRTWNAP